MAIMTDIATRLRDRLSRPGRVQISAKTWSTAYAAIGAPKVFESAEELSFAAAWSPIISRTTLIPASLFVMIDSSCKAQTTSPPQDYPNGSPPRPAPPDLADYRFLSANSETHLPGKHFRGFRRPNEEDLWDGWNAYRLALQVLFVC